ncbi:cholecystokinin [Sphaerodactylus townsendi]|uniref:cholecystokinin n=1 Tax=Sphaerodactylus townsendi TaxID=933632 RepID=UPI0020276260|nr:cholecystokinin [Sphaerodactylus townsendi]XP_048366299.1 cholecystokinin [Sphaerodactylus townsendi]
MYPGICICLLLAVLATSSSGQQPSGSHNANPMISDFEQTLAENHRHARTPASGSPLKSALQVDGNMDHKAILEALLAKYLQQVRRGSPGKISAIGLQGFDPTHRIKDRDYMGWMDFGRRSAEEYEYSS